MEYTEEKLLERYFQGKLSPEESRLINELKEKNPDFKREVDILDKAKIAIKVGAQEQLRDQLKEVDKKLDGGSSTKKWGYLLVLILGLTLIGLALLVNPFNDDKTNGTKEKTEQDSLDLNNPPSLTPPDSSSLSPSNKPPQKEPDKKIYAIDIKAIVKDNFSPFMDATIDDLKNRTREEKVDSIQVWLKNYADGQYQQVIEKYAALPHKFKVFDKSLLILASSYLALGQSKQAISLIENRTKGANGQFDSEFDWLMAWAWLQQDQIAKARPYLESVARSAAPDKQALAQKVLAALNKK